MLFAICFVSLLLLAGVVLRQRVAWFQMGRIPASLIAGGLGLLVVQFAQFQNAHWQEPVLQMLGPWPSTLIAVVFAAMLLGKSETATHQSSRHLVRDVMQQGLMVWIIVIGQTVVGLWMTWWWIGPQFDLPSSAGMLIETGFAGGHGTAAAMGDVFQHPTIQWEAGFDLAVMMATGGLVYGLVSGIVWIQLAASFGWIQLPDESQAELSAEKAPAQSNAPANAPASRMTETTLTSSASLGRERIDGSILDPLLLQVIWLALAMGIGVLMQTSVGWAAESVETLFRGPAAESVTAAEEPSAADPVSEPAESPETAGESQLRSRLTLANIVGSFPLFIYTLFGGALVRACLRFAGKLEWIDPVTIQRISATSMDLLVVAAVTTLNLAAVASLWVPLTILFVAGASWSTFCLLVLSRKILPAEKWFPLGLINFGMSTGTTATGFVLLRVVDPKLESGAAEDYALAAPLSAPFIGGGMITVALPLLVLSRVSIAWPAIVSASLLVVLIVIGVRSRRSH
ncbi:sodium:glutamate symporter [Rhodopirellula sp. JC740]|uniref:Sodium:glutamate symporter n=1 Tax=Rhodopirellula halodulae TaxID=2894198 RepID=A0ABS8NHJ3_9BACT|nr:sodium/glutamate symporter [Rhodopirellula sp. JC740]MCC9641951.1 sodium:glutamate symporter [Rhodopirellula sp. JC740]